MVQQYFFITKKKEITILNFSKITYRIEQQNFKFSCDKNIEECQ